MVDGNWHEEVRGFGTDSNRKDTGKARTGEYLYERKRDGADCWYVTRN